MTKIDSRAIIAFLYKLEDMVKKSRCEGMDKYNLIAGIKTFREAVEKK